MKGHERPTLKIRETYRNHIHLGANYILFQKFPQLKKLIVQYIANDILLNKRDVSDWGWYPREEKNIQEGIRMYPKWDKNVFEKKI